jgi:hypothetical protein
MAPGSDALGGILSDAPRRDLLRSKFNDALGRLRQIVARSHSKNISSPLAPPLDLEATALDEVATLFNTARELGDTSAVAAIERMLNEVEADPSA